MPRGAAKRTSRRPARAFGSFTTVTSHIVSLVVAVGVLAINPGLISVRAWIPVVFLMALVAATLIAVWLQARRRSDFRVIVTVMIAQAAAFITYFAIVYRDFGLILNGKATTPEFTDALYFSVVTWTTLGYGDFQPSQHARLLAGSEALIGYVYLSLIVRLVAALFRPSEI